MSQRPVDPEARLAYWEDVHTDKPEDGVSWWQSVPELSLALVDQAQIDPRLPVIDVGAGWSTLVDHLLERGYSDLTAIDLSATALATVRARLGEPGADVILEVADVLDLHLDRRYALWHDRAVFHFLVRPDQREKYVATASRAVRPGGVLVLGTFAADGPAQCSGLPTARYDADALAAAFTPGFTLEHSEHEEHVTPGGAVQPFTWAVLRR